MVYGVLMSVGQSLIPAYDGIATVSDTGIKAIDRTCNCSIGIDNNPDKPSITFTFGATAFIAHPWVFESSHQPPRLWSCPAWASATTQNRTIRTMNASPDGFPWMKW